LVSQAIEHAFSHDCLRIYLYVYLPNPEAVSLYESLGFVASGAEPEELNIHGTYHDLQYMSLRNPAGRTTHGERG
jgi:ribosomal protein S18 acetylase RimI-like enzyme